MLRATIGLLVLLAIGSEATSAQAMGHKSEADLARMTPGQRVEEYCDEYYHHAFSDIGYMDLLKGYILHDGTDAVPPLISVIDGYDPTTNEGGSRKKDAWCFAAEGLLSQLDSHVIRLRTAELGTRAIQAMEHLIQRMEAAGFDAQDRQKQNKMLSRYMGTHSELERLQGLNASDWSIQDTLKVKYNIKLSDHEMLGFVRYLTQYDPTYPRWAESEIYRDHSDLNEAGNPRIYVILKNGERFYRLYLQYKSVTLPTPKASNTQSTVRKL
jgi:hypothetical protein